MQDNYIDPSRFRGFQRLENANPLNAGKFKDQDEVDGFSFESILNEELNKVVPDDKIGSSDLTEDFAVNDPKNAAPGSILFNGYNSLTPQEFRESNDSTGFEQYNDLDRLF